MLPEACNGCIKVENDKCIAYADPEVMMRWVEGKSLIGCGLNYDNIVETTKDLQKKRIGQQKHKKKKV